MSSTRERWPRGTERRERGGAGSPCCRSPWAAAQRSSPRCATACARWRPPPPRRAWAAARAQDNSAPTSRQPRRSVARNVPGKRTGAQVPCPSARQPARARQPRRSHGSRAHHRPRRKLLHALCSRAAGSVSVACVRPCRSPIVVALTSLGRMTVSRRLSDPRSGSVCTPGLGGSGTTSSGRLGSNGSSVHLCVRISQAKR